MMPDSSGMEVLAGGPRERDRETPIFMITAYGSVEAAVRGAETRRQRLFLQALGQREADHRDRPHDRAAPARVENTQLKRALKQRYSFPNIIGKSERMVRLLDLVGQVASSRVHHSDHGRNRHRQGAGRQGDPRQLAARRPACSSR